MRGVWLLIHIVGFTLWLGGGIATMIAGITAKRFAPAERLAAYRVMGAIFRIVVAPGVIGVVVAGFMLSMPYMKTDVPGWMGLMMGAGLLGALIALFVVVPTAAQLGRLELDARGELPEGFQRLRKRQIVSASIAGGLGIVALIAATVLR
jgi:hypothetical protein